MNQISFEFSNLTDTLLDPEPLRAAAELICRSELPQGECEVGLLLCDDATIKKYNLLYRGDNAVTDVLCFNLSDELPKQISKSGQTMICDILIDIKQLERQKGSKTIHEELMEIFIHGLLHGFGYDHIRTGDKIVMKEKEKHYQTMMEVTQPSG